jgi:hypothetical protein
MPFFHAKYYIFIYKNFIILILKNIFLKMTFKQFFMILRRKKKKFQFFIRVPPYDFFAKLIFNDLNKFLNIFLMIFEKKKVFEF